MSLMIKRFRVITVHDTYIRVGYGPILFDVGIDDSDGTIRVSKPDSIYILEPEHSDLTKMCQAVWREQKANKVY